MAELCCALGHMVALRNSIAWLEKELGESISEHEKDQLGALKKAYGEGSALEEVHGKGALLNLEHPNIKFCIQNRLISPESVDSAKLYRARHLA